MKLEARVGDVVLNLVQKVSTHPVVVPPLVYGYRSYLLTSWMSTKKEYGEVARFNFGQKNFADNMHGVAS